MVYYMGTFYKAYQSLSSVFSVTYNQKSGISIWNFGLVGRRRRSRGRAEDEFPVPRQVIGMNEPIPARAARHQSSSRSGTLPRGHQKDQPSRYCTPHGVRGFNGGIDRRTRHAA